MAETLNPVRIARWRRAGQVAAEPSFDPVLLDLHEEFGSGTNDPGHIGDLGWNLYTIGSAPSVIADSATKYPAVGAIRLRTHAAPVAGQGGALGLSGTPVQWLDNHSAVAGWQYHWRFSLEEDTLESFRIGLVSDVTVAQPASGFWLRFDTALGDATFQFAVRSGGGAESTVDSGVAPIAGVGFQYNRVRLRSVTAGTWEATLYDASGNEQASASFSSGLPTAALMPACILVTQTAAQKRVRLDMFHARFELPR